MANNKSYEFWTKCKNENIDTSVLTDYEKTELQRILQVSAILKENGRFSGYKAKTEYRISKLYTNNFKIQVYQISNLMDTSKPKNTFYIF
jgi:hypothetical protein